MENEPGNTEDKPKPPPPSLPKGPPPPPAPPAAADPPKQPSADSAAPPLQLGRPGGSGPRDEEDSDAPGADAGMNNRIAATVIDVVIAIGIVVGLSITISLLPDFLGFFKKILGRVDNLVGIAYLLTRDSLPGLGGQSVGKKAMGIRAVTLNGKSLEGDWQPGLIRNVVLIIPLFAFVELFVMITRQDKAPPLMRLGDEWAKTKVINAEKPGAVTDSVSDAGQSEP